ncbi:MAG: lipopolysaccharide biosynthesis protein [Bacteroidota bacterium]
MTQISWLGWGQFASLFLSLISIKLTTSIGTVEYGNFILATSIGGLMSLSFFGPLEQGFIRYYFEYTNSEEERSAYLASVLRLMMISAAVLMIVSIGVVAIAVLHYGQSLLFWGSAGILIIISSLANPFNGLLNAMKLRKQISIIQTLEKLSIVILLFAAGAMLTMDASFVMICVLSATGMFLAVRIYFFRRQMSAHPTIEVIARIRIESIKKIAMYSLPFIIWGWLSWFQFNGERWVIKSMVSTSEAGKYGLAASLVNNSIVLVYGVFIQFVLPSIYSKFSQGDRTEKLKGYSVIKIASVLTVILFSAFAVFLFFAGETVVHIISSKDFIISSWFFLILTIGIGFFYVGQTLAIVGMALQRPEAYIFPKIISAVVSLAGYIGGCYWFGINGIAYAVCFANAFYLISVYIVNRKLRKEL